jgi:beta-galactosidase
MYYYYQAAWTSAPVLHIFPHWNWDALSAPRNVSVWAFSNADSVHLSLNGVAMLQPPHGHIVPPMGHVNWSVPFVAGTLTAIGYKDGKVFCNASVSTAGTADRIELKLVTPKDGVVLANGQDSALVSAAVVDVHGTIVPAASHRISFASSSHKDAAVVGVANGDPANHDATRGATIHLNFVDQHTLNVDQQDLNDSGHCSQVQQFQHSMALLLW